MTPPDLSLADLVPVAEGSTISQSLAQAADMAGHAESLGFSRYWVAEHHGMPGLAGAATSVVLAHVGAHTRTIRLGSGGIMLPNHAPLQIAEQFGTLDALFPGRIDLGLGRAPGSDGRVAAALRLNDPDGFPNQVVTLQAMFAGDQRLGFTAVPGAGADPQLWILGSSTYGAQLAAMLGLPYAFASHFAPGMMDAALAAYREQFRPSAALATPRVMVGCNVFAADTADEARLLASSMQQSVVAMMSGQPRGALPPPREGYYESLPPQQQAMLDQMQVWSAIGTRDEVARKLTRLIEQTGADEVIIGGAAFDHAARRHSLTLARDAMAQACAAMA